MLVLSQTALDKALDRLKKAEKARETLETQVRELESSKTEATRQAQAVENELMASHHAVAKKLKEACELNRGWLQEKDQLQAHIKELSAQMRGVAMENSVLRDEWGPLAKSLQTRLEALQVDVSALRAAQKEEALVPRSTEADPKPQVEKAKVSRSALKDSSNSKVTKK
jgi:chromosome segregation ATPase